jgi:transcriptional regulator with XRE-family HTH domain
MIHMGLVKSRPTNDKTRLRAFGLRVQHLRKTRGLSQEKLANKVGYGRTHMGFVEQGRINVPLVKVFRIADALGVDVTSLFSR